MFSWSEILLIAVVALIFIGPKELPAVLHKLGQMTAKLRRSADEFRRHFDDSMRQGGYQDLQQNLNDLRSLNPSTQLRSAIDSAINQDYAPMPQPAGTQPSAAPSFASSSETQASAPAVEPPATTAPAPPAASAADNAAASTGAAAAEPSKDHAARAA